MRDPRQEAFDRLGGTAEVRVLEPSPPADTTPPYFADDPAARGAVPQGRIVVGPTTAADETWEQRCAGDPDLAAWCSDRWLAAWRPLPPLPRTYAATRATLHAVAEHVLAKARYDASGKIGLRWTRGGFGTPFFRRGAADVQARIDGVDLVVTEDGAERRHGLRTLAEAARFVGVEPGAPADVYPPSTPLELDRPLDVDPASVAFLDAWLGLATSVLEQLRADMQAHDDSSRVQLWPEHFDLAFDAGDERAGARANYGASPGDDGHPEPYLYVGPWTAPPDDPGWNATSFTGALLPLRDLVATDGQRARALAFYAERCEALRS